MAKEVAGLWHRFYPMPRVRKEKQSVVTLVSFTSITIFRHHLSLT